MTETTTTSERESGMAMLTAILVCTVVMFLGITAVALSDHSLGTQRVDRKRVATFHSAEAGIDHALQLLQTTAQSSLPCGTPLAASLGSGPGAADYSVTFQYFDSAGSPLTCPLGAPPASVLLSSTGDSSDPVGSSREVQVHARLGVPVTATDLDKVVFSNGNITFTNNVSIDGNLGNDAVVYTNGNYSCANSYLLVGVVYAQGTAELHNSCGVRGDVWANGAVTMDGSATVGRDVTSSTSTITMSGQALVRRNARAATTITTNNTATIQGLRIPSSPTWSPPAAPFPQVTYVQAAWEAAGYTVRTYTNCPLAETELKTLSSTWTSPTVVRITGCRLDVANLSTITLANHLAIVSDFGIQFSNNTTVRSADANLKELHLIVPYGSTCSSTQGRIELGNNFAMPAPVRTFTYSPCYVALQNSGVMQGQFYGQVLDFVNATQLAYRPVSGVPGYTPVTTTTFVRHVAVLYRREVVQ